MWSGICSISVSASCRCQSLGVRTANFCPMVVLVAVHASRSVCWAPISGSQGMFETAVVAFHFRRFLVAAVFVYVSFYGVYVFLFALKLFSSSCDVVVSYVLAMSMASSKVSCSPFSSYLSWIFLCFVPTMSCSMSRSSDSILSLNLHFEA